MFNPANKIETVNETNESQDEDDEDKRTLFCANLTDQITEDLLYELFIHAGPIERVRIPKEADGKRQKSFGFVTYVHKCTIPYALKLYDGIKLFKRNIIIKSRNNNTNRNGNHNNDNQQLRLNAGVNIDPSALQLNQMIQLQAQQLLLNNMNPFSNMNLLSNLNLNPFAVAAGAVDIPNLNFANNLNQLTSIDDRIDKNPSTSRRNERRHHNNDKPYQRPENHRNDYRNNRHYDHHNRQDRNSNQRRNR